ncbi:hypothetical protein OG552_00405 [Streptomyces sp. NBC_01476]|nr:hypothetical protein [Streptomyces sp. NBC_01476]
MVQVLLLQELAGDDSAGPDAMVPISAISLGDCSSAFSVVLC